MNVDLILAPKDVTQTVPVFNSLMTGFHFVEGHRYADFVAGDKLAGYGLTALIAGGAGAALVKTGLLAKFWKVMVALFAAMWKFLAILFAAIVARIKSIWSWFTSLFSGGKTKDEKSSNTLGSTEPPVAETHSLDYATEMRDEVSIKTDHVGD